MRKVCWLHLEIFLGNLLNTHSEQGYLTSAHPALLVSCCAVLKEHQSAKQCRCMHRTKGHLKGWMAVARQQIPGSLKASRKLGPAPKSGATQKCAQWKMSLGCSWLTKEGIRPKSDQLLLDCCSAPCHSFTWWSLHVRSDCYFVIFFSLYGHT